MKEFKKGDKVVCSERGDGVVTDMLQVLNYPVIASFKNVMESYTADGRRLKDSPITLRHAEPDQAELPDLTKILKVGDNAWSPQTGEAKVIESPTPIYPILLERSDLSRVGFDKYGRRDEYDAFPSVRPIDQIPAPPQWPTQPQILEWEGETYEAGEWVAVRTSGDVPFGIRKLADINMGSVRLVYCSDGLHYSKMRKLKSFNQD